MVVSKGRPKPFAAGSPARGRRVVSPCWWLMLGRAAAGSPATGRRVAFPYRWSPLGRGGCSGEATTLLLQVHRPGRDGLSLRASGRCPGGVVPEGRSPSEAQALEKRWGGWVTHMNFLGGWGRLHTTWRRGAVAVVRGPSPAATWCRGSLKGGGAVPRKRCFAQMGARGGVPTPFGHATFVGIPQPYSSGLGTQVRGPY